ncbi:MAG TPA: hypothetical protein VN133_14990 [Humibacter sp.]|nr:hypothetical protein [Humibacter sp.]
MEWAERLTPDEFWERIDAGERSLRDSAAAWPSYTVAGWQGPAMVGEWAFGDGVHAIVHGDPLATRRDADDLVLAGLEEPHVLVRTGDDDARRTVHLLRRAASRPGEAFDVASVAHAAPDEIAEIVVESTPVLFEVWRDPDCWWAAGSYRDDVIVIEARGLQPASLRLVRVADIERFIAQRREWIIRLRREAATECAPSRGRVVPRDAPDDEPDEPDEPDEQDDGSAAHGAG